SASSTCTRLCSMAGCGPSGLSQSIGTLDESRGGTYSHQARQIASCGKRRMETDLLEAPVNCILHGDCRDVLRRVRSDYFSVCVTDPPYNYEFIGPNWDPQEIERRLGRIQNSSTLVKNIPYGSGLAGGVRTKRWYQRVRENILAYQQW